ncbi:GntR family transcriptional regulator [Mesobacillus foraminis]|uniref:GntR family transcriptional regulator n=1 Tax=Mesobacillus foraminis TaxID=279826 RepID=UPI000EF4FF5F|nr:GntR family transcriptional regulator [Mesobacillus foraminis]
MKTHLVKVSTVNKEVYEQLRSMISRGEIPPGHKLTIRTLAEKFGVSTMPVREAIRRLQAEGFLQVRDRSVIVPNRSHDEVRQIFFIRQQLETLAVDWAYYNFKVEDIERLKMILLEMDAENIPSYDWHLLNRKFHLELYSKAKSAPLLQLIKNVWDTSAAYIHLFQEGGDSFEERQAQHYLMIKLLEEKNTADLMALVTQHLTDSFNRIKKEMDMLQHT